MSFSSWLRNRSTVRRAVRPPVTRFRPRLDSLDDRIVLSTLLVTSPADNVSNITPGTLRYEINHAQPGDTIAFAPNLFPATAIPAIHLSGQLTISRDLTIQGPGAGQLAVSAGYGMRVFQVSSGVHAAISGLTIENGNPVYTSGPYTGQGGGILNLGTLALSDCIVTHNRSSLGGGIANWGTLTVNHCIVSYNTSQQGGGIYNGNNAIATVSNSTFTSNTSNNGGVIYNSTNVQYTDGGGNTFS